MNLRAFFGFPAYMPPYLRSNFTHLLFDIGWWGLYVGTTAAFLSIYAARSGATPYQIGLLTAIPAFISLLVSLPAGRVLRRFPARVSGAVAALIARSLFLGYALLPWLLPSSQQVMGVIVLSMVIAIPATFIGIIFNQFLMESVPSEWRGQVVGARTAVMSIVSFAATMLSGQILTYLPFPLGYQVVFGLGALGGVMTAYHIWNVHPVPAGEGGDAAQPPASSTPTRLALGALERNYLKVIVLLFLFNLSNFMAAPLVPDILVHRLQLSDALISLGSGIANMLVFSISLFMARLSRRAGNRRLTALGGALLALHALTLAAAQNAPAYILAALVGGVAAGLLGTAQYNYHLDNLPAENRSTWLSWNMLLGNAAILLGALGGPALAQLSGTPAALVVLGGLRLAFGLLILRWG